MEDIKAIIAKNIYELRLGNNMTQLELAEKLNYSDKAISKWERGESVPDISVLVQIADLFGVTLDSLAGREMPTEQKPTEKKALEPKEARYNHRAISYISEGVVWFCAIFAFIITSLIIKRTAFQWLYFVYALPVALIVKLVFNSVWFNPRHNYIIISGLMWSLVSSVHITFMYFGIDVSLVYLAGVAAQILIIMWSFIKKPKRKP